MKNLKFLIMVCGIMIAQVVLAVTLPTTSYTPHSSGDSYSSESVYGGGSLIAGSFNTLGTEVDVCASATPGVPSGYGTCEDCCDHYFPDDESSYLQCVNACEQGPSLPIDAPLWFMLVIAVLSVTLRAYARRVSQAA